MYSYTLHIKLQYFNFVTNLVLVFIDLAPSKHLTSCWAELNYFLNDHGKSIRFLIGAQHIRFDFTECSFFSFYCEMTEEWIAIKFGPVCKESFLIKHFFENMHLQIERK